VTTRAHFYFRVDRWDELGDNILDHVAGIEDYQEAQATFEAACKRWPGETITLRSPQCSFSTVARLPRREARRARTIFVGGRQNGDVW
jgi:hypothetical protein